MIVFTYWLSLKVKLMLNYNTVEQKNIYLGHGESVQNRRQTDILLQDKVDKMW